MRTRLTYGAFAACFALILALAPPGARADDSNKEYLVKAAFIYNFIKFIEWPDGKAIAKQSNIDICVLGESPMNNTAKVFEQASTSKLSLSLVKEKDWNSVPDHCHVLFISGSQEQKLDDILSALKDKPVLTVSDINHFAERGGMIGFVASDNKIKLEVNAAAADAAHLRVDAQLLEIALKVIRK